MQSFTRVGQCSLQYRPGSHAASYALALAVMATVEPSLSSCVAHSSGKAVRARVRCQRATRTQQSVADKRCVRSNTKEFTPTLA